MTDESGKAAAAESVAESAALQPPSAGSGVDENTTATTDSALKTEENSATEQAATVPKEVAEVKLSDAEVLAPDKDSKESSLSSGEGKSNDDKHGEAVELEHGEALQEEVTQNPVIIETPRDPNLVSITLRPMDKNWVMGEDWVVDFHNMTTIIGVREFVGRERQISHHRIQLRLKGKVLASNREIWTLRRLGIYDGYVIFVEPTLSGAWLWEPKQYYIDKLLTEVEEIVRSSSSTTGAGRISFKDLSAKISPPPCIKCSLRVFLRQYPERIYIHTDTTDGELWVHIATRPFQMPTFGNFSVEIGTFPYYKPKYYNWAANQDIDDMYKIETLPEEDEEEKSGDVGAGEGEGRNEEDSFGRSTKEALAAEVSARQAALADESLEQDAADEGSQIDSNSLQIDGSSLLSEGNG